MEAIYLRTEPYLRRDGAPSSVHVWHLPCATCGQPFEVKSPGNRAVSNGLGTWVVNKNCPLHKGCPTPALLASRAKWAAAVKEGRERKKQERLAAGFTPGRPPILSDADVRAIKDRAELCGEGALAIHASYPQVTLRTVLAIIRGERRQKVT